MDTSVLIMFSSNTVYLVFVCCVVAMLMLLSENYINLKFVFKRKCTSDSEDECEIVQTPAPVVLKRAPGPKRYPIVGNLPAMRGYEVPYQAFNDLGKQFGDVFSMQLGNVPAMVVNGLDNIREVLISKSASFDGRPNFRRYHQLFSGNKENSLAFCDWSEMQKARREMLTPHLFPKNFSLRFGQLNEIIGEQLQTMTANLKCDSVTKTSVEIKPIIMSTCANIFTQYFASRTFSDTNDAFRTMMTNFDRIFSEVNQGSAVDFLPFLLPFYQRNLRQMEKWSTDIRKFILENIIENRYESWHVGDEPNDYVDALIDHCKQNAVPQMDWETALFALEDIVGGHSAIGNFLVKVFGFVGTNPQVQLTIQAEVDAVLERQQSSQIQLSDRNQMPYTEAVILETLRLIASPIVPHVSNQDTSIAGFHVPKDTLIFLNNYDLSMSSELWTEPEVFDPNRFLTNGRLVKPDFFMPFGAGRRQCIGYKMVNLLSFSVIATVMQNFNLLPLDQGDYKVPIGSLHMPEKTYEFKFVNRE